MHELSGMTKGDTYPVALLFLPMKNLLLFNVRFNEAT